MMETAFDYHTYEYSPEPVFGTKYKIYGIKGEQKTLLMAAKDLKAVFKVYPELANNPETTDEITAAYYDLKKRFSLIAYDRERLLEVVCNLGPLVDKRHLNTIKKVIMGSGGVNFGLETGNIIETDITDIEFEMLKRGETVD